MISRMLTTTMKRSLSVVKRVRQPSLVFHYARPQWQSIYSAQRAFCDKKGIRNNNNKQNGLSDSGDGGQVHQPDNIDSGLDSTGADGPLLGEGATGTPDGIVGGGGEIKIVNAGNGGSSNVFGYLLSQSYGALVWYREKKKTTPQWKYGEKFLQYCGIVGLLFTVYYQRQQSKAQEERHQQAMEDQRKQWAKENKLTEGQISDKEAKDVLKQCVLEAFKNKTALGKEDFFVVNRSATPAGQAMLRHCWMGGSGVVLMYGSKDIGKSVLFRSTFNSVIANYPAVPIVHLGFEKNLHKCAMLLNAFPPETRRYKPMPEDKIVAFEEAIGMLTEQLESEENKFGQPPVLMIDSINQIPDGLFDTITSNLKYLIDRKKIKVIILASNGASREKVLGNKHLLGRIGEQVEITNNFTLKEVAQVLEHDKSFCDIFTQDNDGFLLIAKAMYNVFDGRIGYLNKLNLPGGTAVTRILKVIEARGDTPDEETLKKLEETMVDCLFDNVYANAIEKAFDELAENGFSVDGLIDANLPSKINGRKAVRILEYYNIIDTLNGPIKFESEPLKRIFASETIRQKIRERMVQNQLLKK